jgi:hypothetical protein
MREPLDREAMFDFVAAYALGTLPQADQAHVAAFILSDPDARHEYEQLRATANTVGLTAEEPVDSTRSTRMKERLMAHVRNDVAPQRMPSVASRSSVVWGTALAAAAAIVFALVSVIQNLGLRSDLADAHNRTAALQSQIAAEHRRVERDDRILADLSASDSKRYAVAYGTVVTRGTHVYLALTSLPAVPRGRVYQAWTFAHGSTTPLPSLTFTPSPSGVTLVPMPEDATKTGAVALTVEPDGGSKAPTSKPAFVQPLS